MNKSTIVRLIIIVILLILAALAGLLLGTDTRAQGGGIEDPFSGPYHSYLPTIRYEPNCPRGCLSPWQGKPEGCWIKGVVTGMGNWLYYTPDMKDWCDALLIIKYSGRWFCFENEAIELGYVKATPGVWNWPRRDWCYDCVVCHD